MTIGVHLSELGGLPTFDFPGPKDTRALPEPADVAWRISVDTYDAEEEWAQAFGRFTESVDTRQVRALIVGGWSDAYEASSSGIVEALVEAAPKFPALRALFLGDITFEECEISWIQQSDVGPLLPAYPALEEFAVRGGEGLVFPPVEHAALRVLRLEAGGLPKEVVAGVARSGFPALTELDLWLGTSDYGGDAEVGDLEPFLSGERLPALRRLALRNSEIQDAVAAALATAPVVERLEVLDLSMGVLTDEGVEALLAGRPLTHLTKLDLHHHYVGEPLRERLSAALVPHGVEVDLGDPQTADVDDDAEYRYVAVAE
ncbi:STM4015 family protein [Streptomyces sp. NBC_01264]|uniref:STM4015 family protein n=1 Tax=Streptomyces sp. NBC_01264 TaxID=2903804 RepID=UPI00224E0F8B|nr:STM4015 family protein [Streptomyces sp. NBC_01264]MCX4776399.1 STM4015 family protein [Streptomyces sp. NBC_01264]